ncbi:hypothetical protein Syun_024701 [Stephania yunnanensis]|uniref:Chloroplast envelope membrane protein n=1 Tax=Stephania yunnanensis TaxID=152371 RepID=A0AAP0EQ89_9MAGN
MAAAPIRKKQFGRSMSLSFPVYQVKHTTSVLTTSAYEPGCAPRRAEFVVVDEHSRQRGRAEEKFYMYLELAGWLDDKNGVCNIVIIIGTKILPTEFDIKQLDEAWRRRRRHILRTRRATLEGSGARSRCWGTWISRIGTLPSLEEESRGDFGTAGDAGGGEERSESKGGFIDSARQLLLGDDDDDDDDDDFTYEDRVFQYASSNSAKFLAFLVILPWALDFMVHDYLLMPFLDRYVKTVPLAAEFFDVRRSQKLDMIKSLKVEEARFRFEIEIGKSPPLSDEEVWLELRHKALELRDEWRLENRKRFANIWSDMVYGIAVFILLYFNQSKVALLQFTGYKILNNVSDTGKAFLIILITDIFLGYHSESGWQTLLEILVEHYGLEVDQSAITIFVCFVPVVIDACVKLWLFKFLPRLSPKVANIFQEMKRH